MIFKSFLSERFHINFTKLIKQCKSNRMMVMAMQEKKWKVVSASKQQVHKRLIQFSKFTQCSLRWIKPSLNLVRSFRSGGRLVSISFNKYFLKTVIGAFLISACILFQVPLNNNPRKKRMFKSISLTLVCWNVNWNSSLISMCRLWN